MGKKGPRISQAEFIMADSISNEDPRWVNVIDEYLRGCSSHAMEKFVSSSIREQIGAETVRYAEWKSMELDSAPMSAAVNRLDRLRKKFEGLYKEIHSDSGRDIAEYCKNLIDTEYKHITKMPDATAPWEEIDTLCTAVELAQQGLRQSKGFPGDTAFSLWIVSLIGILEPEGWSVTINKGALEGGATEQSPCARLVWALQEQFVPADLHQHMHSITALAKAMDDVRRDTRVTSRD
jgi:hypothetical protein